MNHDKPDYSEPTLTIIERGHLAHLGIFIVSLCLSEIFHSNISSLTKIPTLNAHQLLFLWLPAAILPCICHYLCGSWSDSYRDHWNYATADLLEASPKTKITLALGAAASEEILFRCVLQPWSGILLIVLLVMLLTPGPSGKLTPITALCCGQALLYGQMVEVTESIWPSFFAHCVINIWFVFFTPQQDTSFA
ncbi:MAG: CPBP family glutamic-type intramembrane protease [Oligoflexales bacterium]